MSNIPLWQQDKKNFKEKTIDQILAFCGTGKLGNNNKTSLELQRFLDSMSPEMLKKYANDCLITPFKDSGLVLQDIINQIGKRIGFNVTYGLYRGVQGENGFDGLWKAMDGHNIVIEVKTTDTYRINLDTISNYRKMLINSQEVDKEKSSILIVVGRQDTGDLEAQIRGSKHAWDIRVISVDALIKLMYLKEQLNNTTTFNQINELLKPLEYTRVDNLIDITFNTSEDLLLNTELENSSYEDFNSTIINSINENDIQITKSPRANFNNLCVNKISKKYSIPFIKQANSLFISSDNTYGIACVVSKKYYKKSSVRYWFSFHPYHVDFLEKTKQSSIVFGCGSEDNTLEIPFKEFKSYLSGFRKTTSDTKNYWHIDIYEEGGKFTLYLSKAKRFIDITNYLLP